MSLSYKEEIELKKIDFAISLYEMEIKDRSNAYNVNKLIETERYTNLSKNIQEIVSNLFRKFV